MNNGKSLKYQLKCRSPECNSHTGTIIFSTNEKKLVLVCKECHCHMKSEEVIEND